MISSSKKCPYCGSATVNRLRRPMWLRMIVIPTKYYHCDWCLRHFIRLGK